MRGSAGDAYTHQHFNKFGYHLVTGYKNAPKIFRAISRSPNRKKKLFCISLFISRRKPHVKSGLHPKPPMPSPLGVHFVFSKAYVGHHHSQRSCNGVARLIVLSKES